MFEARPFAPSHSVSLSNTGLRDAGSPSPTRALPPLTRRQSAKLDKPGNAASPEPVPDGVRVRNPRPAVAFRKFPLAKAMWITGLISMGVTQPRFCNPDQKRASSARLAVTRMFTRG